MKALAEYILKGRWQAALAIFMAGIAAAFLPLLSTVLNLLAAALIALVTLHVGPVPGLQVMALGALGTGLFYVLVGLPAATAAVIGLLIWLPVWLLAVILEQTRRLDYALRMGVIFGAVLLIGIYALFGDPAPWWMARLPEIGAVFEESGVVLLDLSDERLVAALASLITGLMIAWLTLGIIGSLLLARWLQSQVVHPGGFGEEFCELRLGMAFGLLTLAAMLVSRFAGGAASDLLSQLVLVMLIPYLFAGYAVLHNLVRRAVLHRGWLIGAYVLPALWQPAVLLLAGAGLLDTWVDFRRRLGRGGNKHEN